MSADIASQRPPGDETAPSGDRLSRCSAWHTARYVLHNDTSCAFCASQPEILEDRTVHGCLGKQAGGEGDGAERQVDRPADGHTGVSDSGSLSDKKNPKIHSDWGGFQSRMFLVQVYEIQEAPSGTSLVVQWLRLCLLMQEVWVRCLLRELICYMPCDQRWGRDIKM